MRIPVYFPQSSNPEDETAIASLYQHILDAWNRRDAHDFAAQFDPDSYVVGFDGSQMTGQSEIEANLRQIFTDHQTAAYLGIIRGVRFVAPNAAILRAVVGTVPPGQSDINPAVNAIQTLTVVQQQGQWRAVLLQTTPAQFHGRPDLSTALTEELRKWL